MAIFVDVEDSILVGVALSILLFIARASRPGMRELIVTPERLIRERAVGKGRAKSLLIYDVEGELFFGAAPQFSRYLTDIINEAARTGIKYVVVRLKRTWNPDVVVVEHLEQFLHDAQTRGITVFLAGVRPDFLKIIENVGLVHRFSADHIFSDVASRSARNPTCGRTPYAEPKRSTAARTRPRRRNRQRAGRLPGLGALH